MGPQPGSPPSAGARLQPARVLVLQGLPAGLNPAAFRTPRELHWGQSWAHSDLQNLLSFKAPEDCDTAGPDLQSPAEVAPPSPSPTRSRRAQTEAAASPPREVTRPHGPQAPFPFNLCCYWSPRGYTAQGCTAGRRQGPRVPWPRPWSVSPGRARPARAPETLLAHLQPPEAATSAASWALVWVIPSPSPRAQGHTQTRGLGASGQAALQTCDPWSFNP